MRSIRLLEHSDFDFLGIGAGLTLTIPLRQKVKLAGYGSCVVVFRLHQASIPDGASVQLVLRQAAPTDEDPAAFFRGNTIALAQLDSSSPAPSVVTTSTNLLVEYVAVFLVVTQAPSAPNAFRVTLSADLVPCDTVGPFALNLAWGGTFTRALAAFYFTQAPTTGASAFLKSAASGVRRSADTRGDGIPASLLMEKSATNYLLNSRAMNSTGWTAGTGTLTLNAANGPDGAAAAAQENAASGQYGPWAQNPGPTGNVVASIWVRAVSGTASHQIQLLNSPAVARVLSVGTTYGRNLAQGNVSAAAGMITLDARDETANGGQVATAQNCYLDMPQLEAGLYPTSPITTTSASVTRPADKLSYAVGTYPTGFLTSGVVIDFAPDASSAQIVSANEDWRLVQVGANDYVRIRNNGGICRAELVCGGSLVVSMTITFSGAQRLTIRARPSAGSLKVSGATTGNGTSTGTGAAWASGSTLYVGGDDNGNNNATGRFVNATIEQAA